MSKIVVDTSVLIGGQLIEQIESGSLRNSEIIIPQAVFDELQYQAASKKEQGFIGLERIKRITEISKGFGMEVILKGAHLSSDEIQLASSGRVDSLIVDMAKQDRATLYTSDSVQHLLAQAEGIAAVFLKAASKSDELEFLKFFDSETMSIHLKENQRPLGKRGRPGAFLLTALGEDVLSGRYLRQIASQIMDVAVATDSSTVEVSMDGASVIQHHDYRIVITNPPFSEFLEITIVHPIAKLSLGRL